MLSLKCLTTNNNYINCTVVSQEEDWQVTTSYLISIELLLWNCTVISYRLCTAFTFSLLILFISFIISTMVFTIKPGENVKRKKDLLGQLKQEADLTACNLSQSTPWPGSCTRLLHNLGWHIQSTLFNFYLGEASAIHKHQFSSSTTWERFSKQLERRQD